VTDFVLPGALREALSGVRSLGVITGAGISAESGISTYRGKGGIYDDPEEGDRTIEALTGETLRADPDRTWRAVAKIARQSLGAQPNAAHLALARAEEALDRLVILTQNVDGLHQAAGSRNVIDIHGTVFETVCMRCSARSRLERIDELDAAPRCTCGGVLRPDVVLFGEMLPETKVARLRAELHDRPPDVVVAIGTSALFPYIAAPILQAKAEGRVTVEINPEETLLSSEVDFALRQRAGLATAALCQALGASV